MGEQNISIERDIAGTLHIKVGEFDYVQIQYQHPFTDNASTRALAERIVSLLTHSAEPLSGMVVPRAQMERLPDCDTRQAELAPAQDEREAVLKELKFLMDAAWLNNKTMAEAIFDAGFRRPAQTAQPAEQHDAEIDDESCPECGGACSDHCGPCRQCGGEGTFEAALRLASNAQTWRGDE